MVCVPTKNALAAGFAAALAFVSTASMAQPPVDPTVPPASGPYDPGAAYGDGPQINGPFGGPPGYLFDYEGPNHGAQVQSH
jgi:hypothetical protein